MLLVRGGQGTISLGGRGGSGREEEAGILPSPSGCEEQSDNAMFSFEAHWRTLGRGTSSL